MVIKQRAINETQKSERRQAILEAALQLFAQVSYDQISMLQVAQAAGLAKGTVYLYFKTKESLFLALLMQEFDSWFDAIDGQLQTLDQAGQACSLDAFIELLRSSLASRPALVRLVAISQAILEQNIDYEAALEFKRALRDRMVPTGALLEGCLPFLSPGDGMRLLLWIYLLVIGVQSVAEPAPIVRQTLQEADLACFRTDFETEMVAIVTAILKGLEVSSGRQS